MEEKEEEKEEEGKKEKAQTCLLIMILTKERICLPTKRWASYLSRWAICCAYLDLMDA